MKAAEGDLTAFRPEPARDIHRAGKLVGLHADQRNQRGVWVFRQTAQNSVSIYSGIGLVIGGQDQLDIRTEYVA